MNGRIVVVGLLGLALGALRVPVVAYTCPMHSDVRASSPGACPRGGMKLVRAKG